MGSLCSRRRAFVSNELCGTAVVGLCALGVIWAWVCGRLAEPKAPAGTDSAVLSSWESSPGSSSRAATAHLGGVESLVNSVGMRLVLIPAGEFQMGSPKFEELRDRDELQHRVRITRPFYLGVHEVTVGQYRRFVEETGYCTTSEEVLSAAPIWDVQSSVYVPRSELTWRNPRFPQADDHPAVYLSWHDAVAFCRWLSSKEHRDYRLPTEAEWEYACRAESATRFFSGNSPEDLFQVANVQHWVRNERGGIMRQEQPYQFTTPVGTFEPNFFGLYDMHGNVWEWCSDWHDRGYYGHCATNDPTGPLHGEGRVVRGGSFQFAQWAARSANRAHHLPGYSLPDVGFRVAMTCPTDK